ncbi:hypothetical protein [Streptomyces sp. NPDC051921]|uniref:hypothetical protein n=1 Tax=Streptomyces sp. NPDC051921 TaxID=3155806 RepID=UPI003445FF2F
MIRAKHTVLGAACTVLLATLVGCGASDAGGSEALTVDRLIGLAGEVGKDGSGSCPLPYDPEKAASVADLGKRIEPGAAKAEPGDPVATAEGGQKTDQQSPWAGKPGALISCVYHVGDEKLEINTSGVAEGSGVYVLAPLIQYAGAMDATALRAYTKKAAEAELHEPVQSEGGNVVTVRFRSGDKGDVAMVLTVGEDGKASLAPEQVLGLAKTFAAQAE